MIKPTISIRGRLTTPIKIKGKTNASIIHVYPELEDIEVTPTTEEQIIKSEMYGIDEVKVLGVTAEIDENIKPENIKEGTSILGVEGGYKGVDTSDATATTEDILLGKTAYVNNEKIEGSIREYDGSFSGNVSDGLKITNASYLFYNKARIENLNDLLKICKNVTNTKAMFYGCTSLMEVDLSNFDTSNVTNMDSMFLSCTKLTEVDLSNFDTSNVTNIGYMFQHCSKLQKINLSSFDTSNVTNISCMFENCTSLMELDIRNFTFEKLTSGLNMFKNVPADCEIIVKSDTEKQWILNVRSDFTNIKTLEDLEAK